ncbi:MAG: glycosyl transferase [Bacteroidales bacterium]|jgi:hypothetical protein|nr:glycosyl transferase [Bacteroidales bacterium]
MIPKIIHYCWLGSDSYPPKIEQCMRSWKEKLPDYEFRLWDASVFEIFDNTYARQALEVKKYAFAADVIRLYALFYYGGIYLDSDVEVLKTFDDLLHLDYFLGEEYSVGGNHTKIEAAVMGAEKGSEFIGKCLDYYRNRKFIDGLFRYDMQKPLPVIMKEILERNYSLHWIQTPDEIRQSEKDIFILPVEFFSPKSWQTKELLALTDKTYTIHHFNMSWVKKRTYSDYFADMVCYIKNKIKELFKRSKKNE